MGVTSKGLRYPDNTGHDRIWEHVQALAEDVDELLLQSLPVIRTKSVDTGPRASTTVAADDPHLVLPVRVTTTYLLQAVFYIRCTSLTPDFKLQWTFPLGCFLTRVNLGVPGAGVSVVGDVDMGVNGVAANSDIRGTVNGDTALIVTGHLTTAAAAGNFTLQWAQGTSDAAGVTLLSGSWVMLTPSSVLSI